MTVATDTLSALSETPRLVASEDVTTDELNVEAVTAAASEAEPSSVISMVTDVVVAMGEATLTL